MTAICDLLDQLDDLLTTGRYHDQPQERLLAISRTVHESRAQHCGPNQ